MNITFMLIFIPPLVLASLANFPPDSTVEMVVVLLTSLCMQLSAQTSLSLLQDAAGLLGVEHSSDLLHVSQIEDLQQEGCSL